MNIFDYDHYKVCINEWIKSQPHNGHGQLRQIALHLNVNSVIMSQVFRGDRHLTLEQALSVSQYLGLTEMERDYFLVLVQIERAGTYELKNVLKEQLEKIKLSSQSLKNRIHHQKFSEKEKATFYSQWYYSAIRLAVSIPKLNSISMLADHLRLDRILVSKVLEFLKFNKLIVTKEKWFDIGPRVTHVGHDSPFVTQHHSNWRIKGLQKMEVQDQPDLFYTGPMALSKEDTVEIRKLLVDLISKSTRIASQSDSETLQCLNIDWFKVGD